MLSTLFIVLFCDYGCFEGFGGLGRRGRYYGFAWGFRLQRIRQDLNWVKWAFAHRCRTNTSRPSIAQTVHWNVWRSSVLSGQLMELSFIEVNCRRGRRSVSRKWRRGWKDTQIHKHLPKVCAKIVEAHTDILTVGESVRKAKFPFYVAIFKVGTLFNSLIERNKTRPRNACLVSWFIFDPLWEPRNQILWQCLPSIHSHSNCIDRKHIHRHNEKGPVQREFWLFCIELSVLKSSWDRWRAEAWYVDKLSGVDWKLTQTLSHRYRHYQSI